MAEKFIHINVAAKIPTLADCVKLKAGQSYSATIIQGDDYDGNSGVNLVFNNFCSEAFTVPSIDWFTDTVDGGNFRAYTDSFIILPNQEKSIPLKFIGIYLSDVTSHAYTLTLNGVSNTFALTITIPVENNPPIISNFSKLLENRAEYTFLLTDFTSKYSDIDGNPLDGVIISGDTSNFILQGLPLVSGTEITPTQISSGHLKYVSLNVNTQSQSTVTWYAKDSLELTSNPATITMTSKSYCVAPTLNNVAFVNNSTVLYDWNNNGVDYGVSGSIILEVSTNGGASYVAIGSVSPNASPTTVTSPILNSITNGSSVKFRITANGGACVSQSSNVITITWSKNGEVSISNVSKTNGRTCFTINVLYSNINAKYTLISSINQDGTEYASVLNIVNSSQLNFTTTTLASNPTNNIVEETNSILLSVGTHNICLEINEFSDNLGTPSTTYESYGVIVFTGLDDLPINGIPVAEDVLRVL